MDGSVDQSAKEVSARCHPPRRPGRRINAIQWSVNPPRRGGERTALRKYRTCIFWYNGTDANCTTPIDEGDR
jgi:hypothetical protein